MTFDTDFIETAHQTENRPVWLYRIHLSDDPFNESDDLFLAESELDIDYFKDVSTAQTYTAFGIRHEGIPANARLEIPVMEVIVGNINRDMQAYLEEHNGLHGCKITVRVVFQEDLADAAAHREEVFYVDTATTNAREARFACVGKLGYLGNVLPGRMFYRNACAWKYKGPGCYEDNGATQPTGFLTDSRRIFDYLDILDTLTGAGTATAEANFRAFDLAPWGAAADQFRIDLKITNISNATLASGYIEIASNATDGHRWTDLSGLGLVEDTFKTLDFTFSAGSAQGAGLAAASISRVSLVIPFTGAGVATWRNAYGRGTNFDSCDKTIKACRWHKNVSRIGAFPNIPRLTTYRG